VTTEKERLTPRIIILLFTGIILSWFANILRMSTIVYIGYQRGNEALYWAHENLGLIIFVLWMMPFWFFMMWFLGKDENSNVQIPVQKGPSCAICKEALTHVEPSFRCHCANYYHKSCAGEYCPVCGVSFQEELNKTTRSP
ncbi:MAG TPA: hypothetical protein ENN76_00140, partial [Euryarchaeota archaeon]|nr:hypothetical protein [Euryarchaeota archaeon]